MPDADVARTEVELQMLARLVDCAHELSLAVAEAARAETDRKVRLQLFEAFQRGFLAVRMGIRLRLMLRSPLRAFAQPAPATARETPETERLETERPETDGPVERERDRDYEPVSLPKFLSTLGVVASDAARLPGLPAHVRAEVLPTLDALLARAKAPAAPTAVTPTARPKAPPKAALLGAASAIPAPPLAGHPRPRPPPWRSG